MLYQEVARLGSAAFEPGAKVVWTTAYAFPMTLFQPFDLVPFDFEYSSVFLATAGRAGESLETSNRLGYAVDTCSAHRMALGADALGFFPHPDLLISTTHFCDGKPKCNEIFKEKYNVPFHLIDIPLEKDASAVDYVEVQIRKLFSTLCRMTGTKEDESILLEPIRNYNAALALMEEMMTLRQQKPAPYLPSNRFYTMSMIGNILYGKQRLIEIYKQLLKEMKAAPREGGPDGRRTFPFVVVVGKSGVHHKHF